MKRFAKYFLSLVLAIALPFIFTSGYAYADVDDFEFESMDVNYHLTKNSAGNAVMEVEETLVAIFPDYDQNHGIVRTIPYTNNNGENLTVSDPDHFKVKVQRNGEDQSFTKSIDTDDEVIKLTIRSDEFLHGRQTYTISYQFENMILDHTYQGKKLQELYWDVNGDGWSQPFRKVTARLDVDQDIFDHVIIDYTSCYTGKHGSSDGCDDGYSLGNTFYFESNSLGEEETMTFSLSFDADTFKIKKRKETNVLLIVSAVTASISLAVLLFVYIKFYKKSTGKRRYYKSHTVVPQYLPLRGYTAAELGSIYVNNTKKDMAATMVEMVVRRNIQMIKSEKGHKKTGWKCKILSLDGLTKSQKIVLQIMKGGKEPIEGEEFELIRHDFATNLEQLGRDYNKSVVREAEQFGDLEPKKHGHYDSVSKFLTASKFGSTMWFILFAVSFAAVILAIDLGITTIIQESNSDIRYDALGWFGASMLLALASGILVAVVLQLVISNSVYGERTKRGLDASKYAEGLKLYIKMAEADRLKVLQSVEGAETTPEGIVKLYEKLLPYAMLFGLEKSWIKELGKYCETHNIDAPDWYMAGFTYAAISSVSTNSVYSGSSSSYGGGGGGYAGGGGGGGGGGGC